MVKPIRIDGEPAGTRTQDPRLKRALLYQLSYGLSLAQSGRNALRSRQATVLKLTQSLAWLQLDIRWQSA